VQTSLSGYRNFCGQPDDGLHTGLKRVVVSNVYWTVHHCNS